MAVEIFSWSSLHERMCRIELGATCMPRGHASDRATAPGYIVVVKLPEQDGSWNNSYKQSYFYKLGQVKFKTMI